MRLAHREGFAQWSKPALLALDEMVTPSRKRVTPTLLGTAGFTSVCSPSVSPQSDPEVSFKVGVNRRRGGRYVERHLAASSSGSIS